MNNKDKKRLKKLHHLMYVTPYSPAYAQYTKKESYLKDKRYKEIHEIVLGLEMSEQEVLSKWWEFQNQRFKYRAQFRKKPVVIRKDNKDRRVGSGGSNQNKIRFPRKCRKTAWKRFYKLFPHLKKEEND